jgi:uncharacterized protein
MGAAGLLTAVAAAVVWLLSPELPWAPRAWLSVLLAPLPWLAVVQARALADLDDLPRRAAYASSIASLWILAALTAVASTAGGFDAAALGLVAQPWPRTLAWTALLTAAGIGVLFGYRALGFRDAPVMERLMPATRSERAWFVGLSATAGITEEFVFRGFLIHALTTATGSVALAWLLSSTVFGVVHAYQRPAGAVRAGLLGALLALPLLVDGTLLPAIAAHVLIDILSGLWLARYLLR